MTTNATTDKRPADPSNLVLYVCVGEKIIIDDRAITITCIEAGRGGAKLAFEADSTLPIDRERIYKSKKAAGNY